MTPEHKNSLDYLENFLSNFQKTLPKHVILDFKKIRNIVIKKIFTNYPDGFIKKTDLNADIQIIISTIAYTMSQQNKNTETTANLDIIRVYALKALQKTIKNDD